MKQRAKLTRLGVKTASTSYYPKIGKASTIFRCWSTRIVRDGHNSRDQATSLVSKESISSLARDLKLSRQTVRKHLRTTTEPIYKHSHQAMPKLGLFQSKLEEWISKNREKEIQNELINCSFFDADRW